MIHGRRPLKPAAPAASPLSGLRSSVACLCSRDKKPMFQEKEMVSSSQTWKENSREGVFFLGLTGSH